MRIQTKELGELPDTTVYVHVNTFDYPKLIARIIKHADLHDTEVSSTVITRIFKDLERVYNHNKRDELSAEEIKVAETFMKEFAGLRFADYEDEEASEFYTALSEAIEWSLQNFQEFLTGGIPEEDVSETTLAFYMALLDLMDIESFNDRAPDDESAVEAAMMTMERLQEILDDYKSGEFSEVQLAILSEMEKLLTDHEIITGIMVEDKPGKTVKYGDSLVTFPIIYIKATGYGY